MLQPESAAERVGSDSEALGASAQPSAPQSEAVAVPDSADEPVPETHVAQHGAPPHARRRRGHRIALIAVACILALCAAGAAGTYLWVVDTCGGVGDASFARATAIARFQRNGFDLTKEGIAAIPASAQGDLVAFSLSDLPEPQIPAQKADAVRQAVAAISEKNDRVSAIMLNTRTGLGLSLNPDTASYSASTIKAPYVAYVLSQLVDTGAIRADFDLPEGVAVADGARSYSLKDTVYGTLRESSNSGYSRLNSLFGHGPFMDWAYSLGCGDGFRSAGIYVELTGRDALYLWNAIDHFLATGSPSAQFMADCLKHTNKSWIRTGIEGTGATVLNKAGWIFTPVASPNHTSTSDNAIIELDGERYLLCLITSCNAGDSAYRRVADVAAALFDCRDALSL